jgi:transposase InsO family protein
VDLREITAVEQVWATDITYIPVQKGFLYQVAIMDLHSRHVLSWKLSNSVDTEFCLKALEMGLSSGRRSSTPTKPRLTSWTGCRVRKSRSVGQEESAATGTSLSKCCGGHSCVRMSIYGLTAMAERLKSA